jgi:predicted ribosomally synthesized peptide with nif11-like leader
VSTEGLRALIDRVESDDSFRERVLAMSPEEKREAIREAGYEIDRSDLASISSMTGYELSDEELDQVAGGGSVTSITVGASVGGTISVAGVAAIAAGAVL